MTHLSTARQAIQNAGGVSQLAYHLCKITGNDDYYKMYNRVRKWRMTGVPILFLRPVSRIGKVAITKLIPEQYK